MSSSRFNTKEWTGIILFTGITALAFGFGCFLSLNFLFLGDLVSSIIGAISISLILFGLAFWATFQKKAYGAFERSIRREKFGLIVFVIFALVFLIVPFSHYFAVSQHKSKIQETIINNITEGETMFSEYEKYVAKRQNHYEIKLESVVNAKKVNLSEYTSYGFESGTADSKQIESKMFALKAKLKPSNYGELKNTATNWLASSKATMTGWKSIGIITVVKQVEIYLTEWKMQLTGFSKFKALGETAKDFDSALSFSDVTTEFKTLRIQPSIWAIILAFVAYLFMLAPYFALDRSPKSFYTLFGGKKNIDKPSSTNNGIDVKY